MQRLFHVRETAFDLSDDLHKVIDIQTPAGGAGNHGNAPVTQTKRLDDFPGDANFFLRLSRQRNSNCVPNAFMQEDTEADRGLDGPGKGRACFGYTEMKGIVNFFGELAI